MSETFDLVLELSKVFNKKEGHASEIESDLAPVTLRLQPLCLTQWTVRAESLRSIILKYTLILSVLQEIVEEYKSTFEICCQARCL